MQKIMFCILRTLGDVVLGTTIVRELKVDYPDSEIHVFTNKVYAEIFLNNPDVAEIHAPDDWNANLLFVQMGSGNYDKIFCPIQVRPECNAWHQIEETRHQHLVDFYWNRMGRHRPILNRECYLYPSEEAFKKASDHISMDVPRIAVHSTTGVKTKDWPYFNELTEELRKAGYGTVQVGGLEDILVKGAVDLRGKMGFLELAAFISKCAAFVGLDSGVGYIADAMKTPSIIIQGSTDPVTSGPISERVIHLFAKETGYADCQQIRCHSNCRYEVNCNTKISVNDVLDKLEPILDKWKKPIPAGV